MSVGLTDAAKRRGGAASGPARDPRTPTGRAADSRLRSHPLLWGESLKTKGSPVAVESRAEGITYPPLDELLEKTDSKYSLVIEAARRARQINALERDFNAMPELAALVLDLQDELARLRGSSG